MEGRRIAPRRREKMGFLRETVRRPGEAETGVQRRPGEDRERAGVTAHRDGGCGREESRESAWWPGKERWKGWGQSGMWK